MAFWCSRAGPDFDSTGFSSNALSSADGLWHPGEEESGQASQGHVHARPGKQAFILTCPFLRALQHDGVTGRVPSTL